jgi:DNA repair exonuclease SbcCD ATPase subunit
VGVERSVTRWYARRQSILNEIAQLEAQLAEASASISPPVETGENAAELQQQLTEAQEKLHDLGPCPKPMMG